tara:strand:- start:44 stop:3337 length:3294 start_codon:yes stop_codon:yes gene_type:complete
MEISTSSSSYKSANSSISSESYKTANSSNSSASYKSANSSNFRSSKDIIKKYIRKYVKKYLDNKKQRLKLLKDEEQVKENAAKFITSMAKIKIERINRTLKNKFATKIQSRVRGLSLRNKRRGVNIGNILCNEKIGDIKTKIVEYYSITIDDIPIESIDNLRLYNCSFGNKDLTVITRSIKYSTIFNVSFASAKLQSIVFTSVVFLSGRIASQPYKLFTRYYPLDNNMMLSKNNSKKSQSVACDFRNTNLQGCKFTNCTFNSIQFESSKISSVIFQKCKFINCSFISCIFEIKEEPNSVFFSDCDIIFDEHTSNTEFIIHSESVNNSIGLDKCLYKFNKCKFINYCHEVRKIKIISNSLDRNSIIKYIYLVKCDIKSYFINDLLLLTLNKYEYLFYRCNFEDCKFFNSTITSNTFFKCILEKCNFYLAKFNFDIRFENNSFISCYFYSITIILQEHTLPIIIFKTDFTGSQFINTNLAYITFEQCNMYGCDFSPRLIQLPDGRQQTTLTIFYDVNNRNVPNESSTKFIESNIKSCNFSQTMGLIGHDFRKVKDGDLTSVNFTGVELQDSDLEGCKITGTIFAYATLTGCNFRDVREFQNADFTGIVGVPDNIPDGLNINAEILASNEVHTRFSLFKTRHFDSSIRFFVSFCEEKSSVRMIKPDETFTGIEKEIKGLTSDKPQKGEYYDFHEIVNNVDKFKGIFIKIYTDILSKLELDELKRKLDKCIDNNFIGSINNDTKTCNIIMHSLLFLLYQCKFYKQNFIDLYIEEIFNAHGKDSMSCLLGMIERLVTTHCACMATINSLLKPYKKLEELKKNDELYKLFIDLDDDSFTIYITTTKYTFNRLLNLIIPTSLLAKSDEEEKLFDEIMGHLEINFSKIRDNWFEKMQEYYRLKVKLDNKESIQEIDPSIVEQLINDGVFQNIDELLKNYEKTIRENPNINRDIVSKLNYIKQKYQQEYISKKCDEIMRILNSKIDDEKKLVMESIFGLVGKNVNIDENDITEYLKEGGNKKNTTTRKSKAKGISKGKVKVKATSISKTTEKNRTSYENAEKLIIKEFLTSNKKKIDTVTSSQHIDINMETIDKRRITYYFNRYNK